MAFFSLVGLVLGSQAPAGRPSPARLRYCDS